MDMAVEFDIFTIKQLTQAEARDRLDNEGYNELPASEKRGLFKIIVEIVKEPMFLLLIASGILYLIFGDLEEALMLLSFVGVIILITFFQERKTEKALDALRDLSSPRALVVRENMQSRIPGREVVRDDIIILSEGDRVPADALVLSTLNLSIDESLLTGESVPVRKIPWDGQLQSARPGGDDFPFVYSGTLVVQGTGIARVTTIGVSTEMGKIGKSLTHVNIEETLLQKEIRVFIRNFAIIGLILCTIVIVLYGLSRSNFLGGFLAGITLAMAILPEEFPVVLTIFLALGAWRMSRNHVLTRRMPAIETLGSASVICVDKTGTLTQNRMTVTTLAIEGQSIDVSELAEEDLPEKFHEVLELSILASQTDPFDPMEKAIRALGNKFLAETEHIHDEWVLVKEYPLSPQLLAMSRAWESNSEHYYEIAAKGSPEAILDLCHVEPGLKEKLERSVMELAANGLRMLGVAKSINKKEDMPDHQHDFDFKFAGFIGLADPIRPQVPSAISECHQAGIKVTMITGDYPVTAMHIGKQIGLKYTDHAITGPELENLSAPDLAVKSKETSIFARVVPEQKLRIVNAFKEQGEIVAMTGDGVNDAPALKSAHIGIAMGERGTDVAREAASIVLLDDDFSSIVGAVKMGRRIYDNLKKAMAYILAVHIPIAGLSLLPILFNWPLILLPIHVVFLELIIDPSCSIVFEAEPGEPNIMKRPPRNLKEPMFNVKNLSISTAQGAVILVITILLAAVAINAGRPEDEVRGIAYGTLIVANLGLILTNRSWSETIFHTLKRKNKALYWVAAVVSIFLISLFFVPEMRILFKFGMLSPLDLLTCIIAGFISIMWFEGWKYWRIRRSKIVDASNLDKMKKIRVN
jgi:P-type Ca2+ transporter type 2C